MAQDPSEFGFVDEARSTVMGTGGVAQPMVAFDGPAGGFKAADVRTDQLRGCAVSARQRLFGYLVACENARRIAADPAILDVARDHLERFSRHDPHQRDGYALWCALLDQGPQAVLARLVEPGARGDYARETAPSFGGLPAARRADLLRQARQMAGPEP